MLCLLMLHCTFIDYVYVYVRATRAFMSAVFTFMQSLVMQSCYAFILACMSHVEHVPPGGAVRFVCEVGACAPLGRFGVVVPLLRRCVGVVVALLVGVAAFFRASARPLVIPPLRPPAVRGGK